jgi:hypothetical protein
LPDLTGKTLAEAEIESLNVGFIHRKTTAGGYQEWRHTDGSSVWIGPDGEVDRFLPKIQPDRTKKGFQPRIDQHGNYVPHLPGTSGSHHTGEIIILP